MKHLWGAGSRRLAHTSALSMLLALGLMATGCAPINTDTVQPAAIDALPIYSDITVIPDVSYGAGMLDVCLPETVATDGSLRAVISVHGGSWREGDKASTGWRNTCEWLASEGFAAFSVNYRLAPEHPFPAGINDVRAALDWVRAPAQAERWGYDPSSVGAFGGSAGGNLVSLLGTTGGKVAAVVDLSGPTDLTPDGLRAVPDGFAQSQLDYLGCESYDDCRAAASASPNLQLRNAGQLPRFFVAHSQGDYIPMEQGRMLADALEAAGGQVTLVELPGSAHSIGLLDEDLRARIGEFLRSTLG